MAKTYLHLEDGTKLEGKSFGYLGETSGEVVFSTGMTGYCESLTDPSFAGQILTFTYPLIGNYGVPRPKLLQPHLSANFESERIWAKGVVATEYCEKPSHCQSVKTLDRWLREQKIPGIAGIDTRALTQKLREHGTMRGMISSNLKIPGIKAPSIPGISLESVNWVAVTSCKKPIVYTTSPRVTHQKRIVLIDCGVKHGILRALLSHGYQVTRIPWDANPLDVKHIDGVVCSNGPGDPKECGPTVEHVRKVIAAGIPYLGICLGHQILGLAIGADTYKLPYGHRGLNQPCLDLTTNKAYLTSQNHGYAVRKETIPSGYVEWFQNLNDGTNEGLKHKSKPIRSVQFHPEGNPGPFDTGWLFEEL